MAHRDVAARGALIYRSGGGTTPTRAKCVMSAAQDYVWGTDPLEQRRLLEQIKFYDSETAYLLDRLAIAPGSRAIDPGCGLLGITDRLAERVGPSGEVVGIELEPRFVAMANAILAERGFANVKVMSGDATATGLPGGTFQCVHERLLLIVLPKPENAIAEMVRLAEPGGAIAVEEVDICSWVCEPPHPAWAPLIAAFEQVYTRDGKNVRIGRRLPGLLRAAGLENVRYKAHAQLNRPGDVHQTQLLVFVKLFWQKIIEAGLFKDDELTALCRELEGHLADPGTLVVSPLLFQAWGTKSR